MLQWPMPPEMGMETYGALVEHLAKVHAAVPLGLLRVTGKTHPSEKYVVLASPPSYSRLRADDLIFVLSGAVP